MLNSTHSAYFTKTSSDFMFYEAKDVAGIVSSRSMAPQD